jgi:hypothetical protein
LTRASKRKEYWGIYKGYAFTSGKYMSVHIYSKLIKHLSLLSLVYYGGKMNQANETGYKLNLRRDMPKGFKENDAYPELPAVLEFLTPYEGRTFESSSEFQLEVLSKFPEFLVKNKVPAGGDPKIREGLHIEELPQRFDEPVVGVWDYSIFTLASHQAEKCVFGGLEKIN